MSSPSHWWGYSKTRLCLTEKLLKVTSRKPSTSLAGKPRRCGDRQRQKSTACTRMRPGVYVEQEWDQSCLPTTDTWQSQINLKIPLSPLSSPCHNPTKARLRRESRRRWVTKRSASCSTLQAPSTLSPCCGRREEKSDLSFPHSSFLLERKRWQA